VEQLVVSELLRLAGAHVTRKLSNHNTHLVCKKSIGIKYDKASKRGLHVVTALWVIDSLLEGKRLGEDNPEYQVPKDEEPSTSTQPESEDIVLSQSSP